MQSTIYVKLTDGTSVDDLRNHLQKFYEVIIFFQTLVLQAAPISLALSYPKDTLHLSFASNKEVEAVANTARSIQLCARLTRHAKSTGPSAIFRKRQQLVGARDAEKIQTYLSGSQMSPSSESNRTTGCVNLSAP